MKLRAIPEYRKNADCFDRGNDELFELESEFFPVRRKKDVFNVPERGGTVHMDEVG